MPVSVSEGGSKHFSDREIAGLDPRLVALLDSARGLAKVPFIITSGKRDPLANKTSGGVGDSSHLRGLAVDIACEGSRDRLRIVAAAITAGFRRIGVYNRHVHLDCDEGLPQDVLWTGVSH